MRSFFEGFALAPFGLYIFNTMEIGLLCVLGSLVSCSLTGFGFAKFHSKWKNPLFMVLLATMMVPQTVLLIPSYMLYSKLGWVNTINPFDVTCIFWE